MQILTESAGWQDENYVIEKHDESFHNVFRKIDIYNRNVRLGLVNESSKYNDRDIYFSTNEKEAIHDMLSFLQSYLAEQAYLEYGEILNEGIVDSLKSFGKNLKQKTYDAASNTIHKIKGASENIKIAFDFISAIIAKGVKKVTELLDFFIEFFQKLGNSLREALNKINLFGNDNKVSESYVMTYESFLNESKNAGALTNEAEKAFVKDLSKLVGDELENNKSELEAEAKNISESISYEAYLQENPLNLSEEQLDEKWIIGVLMVNKKIDGMGAEYAQKLIKIKELELKLSDAKGAKLDTLKQQIKAAKEETRGYEKTMRALCNDSGFGKGAGDPRCVSHLDAVIAKANSDACEEILKKFSSELSGEQKEQLENAVKKNTETAKESVEDAKKSDKSAPKAAQISTQTSGNVSDTIEAYSKSEVESESKIGKLLKNGVAKSAILSSFIGGLKNLSFTKVISGVKQIIGGIFIGAIKSVIMYKVVPLFLTSMAMAFCPVLAPFVPWIVYGSYFAFDLWRAVKARKEEMKAAKEKGEEIPFFGFIWTIKTFFSVVAPFVLKVVGVPKGINDVLSTAGQTVSFATNPVGFVINKLSGQLMSMSPICHVFDMFQDKMLELTADFSTEILKDSFDPDSITKIIEQSCSYCGLNTWFEKSYSKTLSDRKELERLKKEGEEKVKEAEKKANTPPKEKDLKKQEEKDKKEGFKKIEEESDKKDSKDDSKEETSKEDGKGEEESGDKKKSWKERRQEKKAQNKLDRETKRLEKKHGDLTNKETPDKTPSSKHDEMKDGKIKNNGVTITRKNGVETIEGTVYGKDRGSNLTNEEFAKMAKESAGGKCFTIETTDDTFNQAMISTNCKFNTEILKLKAHDLHVDSYSVVRLYNEDTNEYVNRIEYIVKDKHGNIVTDETMQSAFKEKKINFNLFGKKGDNLHRMPGQI